MDISIEQQRSSLTTARLAVSALFLVMGGSFANWAARIPEIKDKIGLSEGQLGIALLGASIGLITALTLAGGIVARFSSRKVSIAGGLLIASALPLLALANSFWTLFAALFIFGSFMSTFDVGTNAQGVEVEKRFKRRVMSSLHASFSIGAALGGLMGGVMVRYQVPILTHFLIASGIAVLITLAVSAWLLEVEGENDTGGSAFSLPHRSLWLLGLVAFCAAIGEGSMADWSALYVRNVVGVESGLSVAGFVSFWTLMTLGRFLGDAMIDRFGPVNIVRFGGALAFVGIMLIIGLPYLIPVTIGCALVGFGIATPIPLAFSVAGQQKEIDPGRAIASVAAIGYSGFLAGPPIIGLIAEVTSLRASFVVVMVLMIIMMTFAGAMRR